MGIYMLAILASVSLCAYIFGTRERLREGAMNFLNNHNSDAKRLRTSTSTGDIESNFLYNQADKESDGSSRGRQEFQDVASSHSQRHANHSIGSGSSFDEGSTPEVSVKVDWTSPKTITDTAATIEVDVMPFLVNSNTTTYGGPYEKYYEALSNLKADFVRMAPWTPNPRITVPELTPSDCTKDKPATNWNSTLLDRVMADFFSAVCGPGAKEGKCEKSVNMQISTVPAWLFVGGMDLKDVPANPFVPTVKHKLYGTTGEILKDPTCQEYAEFVGRVTAWYTKGGFQDACGHFHKSDLFYTWHALSVGNENEHNPQKVLYTKCFDATKTVLQKINPGVIPIGPETGGTTMDYILYFMDGVNHADGESPKIATYHWSHDSSATQEKGGEAWFQDWDHRLSPGGFVDTLEAKKKALGSDTRFVVNEFIPTVTDWCDCTGMEDVCPGWTMENGKCGYIWDGLGGKALAGGDPDLSHAKGVKINRKTLSWNAAGAVFAYGFGTLAERNYMLVAQDQLVAGTWPDNEPAVAALDWQTGEPNAKYYVTQLLAQTIGTKDTKTLFNKEYGRQEVEEDIVRWSDDDDLLYALPVVPTDGVKSHSYKYMLLVNKKQAPLKINLSEAFGADVVLDVTLIDSVSAEPGWALPQKLNRKSDDVLVVGAFAVALVRAPLESVNVEMTV